MSAHDGHVPVLMNEVVDALQPRDGGRYVDGTFGGGGYTSAILDRAACEVIAIDRDPDAIAAGKALAERYAPRLRLIEGRFGEMEQLLSTAGVSAVDGVALDLGVSSMQFDRAERGFSFRNSGPLDMRMAKSGASAADLVNGSDETELADIFWRYGEERKSRRVAHAIVERRRDKRIETTGELAEIVRRAVGPSAKDESDPATRAFQALAHRRQRRAGRARAWPRRRRAGAGAGRPSRRRLLPLAGGPRGQGIRSRPVRAARRRRRATRRRAPRSAPPPCAT